MSAERSMPSEKLVLVVDDEPDVLRYQAAILEDAGFRVATAADGAEALQAVEREIPDLVSLDLVMPGKSGIRFIHSLRKRQEWATIPVIIVTGHAHDDLGRHDLADIRSGKAISGPQVCLDKPVRPEAYVAAVRERLGMSETGGRAGPAPGIREEIDERLATAGRATLEAVLDLLKGHPDLAAGETGGPCVLVVDDEPDVVAYMAAMLEDGGYEVRTLTDPRHALETIREERPDLVTLDVDMPGKSGLDVYLELRGDETLREIPVIVITGVERDASGDFRGREGVPDIEAYLRKPVDAETLLGTVAAALGRTTSD